MQVVFGARAFPEFRLERLRRELRGARSGAELRDARFLYLCSGGLPTADARTRLEGLLDEGFAGSPPAPDTLGAFVVPRFGTISPWSSKAGEILAGCGLSAVGRIERGVGYALAGVAPTPGSKEWGRVGAVLADRMVEMVVGSLADAAALFSQTKPEPECSVALAAQGETALREADRRLGLALGAAERAYLLDAYAKLGRDPTETELMMFAQVNSEHCRHKIFRGRWTLDGEVQERSPFDCIRESTRAHPDGILSAYHDNAAVLAGAGGQTWTREPASGIYVTSDDRPAIAIKVETHNHPTGVAPSPGAATGAGGEIRDEAATGRGGRAKAGFTGFAVSDLHLPGSPRPWETRVSSAPGLASALKIMLEAPIGAASFNNEYGRPAIAGFFRSFCQADVATGSFRGYHKPVMLAGGVGSLRRELVAKRRFEAGARIGVLGGPAFAIGLGGGAASSRAAAEDADLDFASVQRGNPEMQRRAQEVIEAASAFGVESPILAIHDVGAGGLSNAVPELLHEAGLGGRLDLAHVPSAEAGMSALALWCNEAQERYVLALAPEDEPAFAALAARERCPWAEIGEATAEEHLLVNDGRTGATVVDLPMRILLGDLPPLQIRGETRRLLTTTQQPADNVTVEEALTRILALPGVGDKSFLITIGDRTIGGLVARDQLIGPWQVAVSDVAVTAADYWGYAGEAMALGERMPVAVTDAVASARLAVGEALTNMAAAPVARIEDVRLSANWMAAAGDAQDNGDLYAAVCAVGTELCPALGLAIPVGKDSLSMRVAWRDGAAEQEVRAPLTLVVSAFAPLADVRGALTPALVCEPDSELWLIDLGHGRNRLGGSAFAQVFERRDAPVPDVDDPVALRGFFASIRQLAGEGRILAYHDRSDGGLALTLIEMAFAGHCGIEADIGGLDSEPLEALFAEELGAVVQVRAQDWERLCVVFAKHGVDAGLVRLGGPRRDGKLVFKSGKQTLFDAPWPELMRRWAEVSYRMRALRDDPDCAREEYQSQCDPETVGLAATQLAFEPAERCAPAVAGRAPRVAILREQGVNGHRELAAVFARAGFEAVDLHMSELADGSRSLVEFAGFAAPGGFSYGDVLGAGQGWAKSILFNYRLRDQFQAFLADEAHFALGICNGCQMLSGLRELIPGSEHWPRFRRNRSHQFEARLSLVEVLESVCPFFSGMEGSVLPVAVAHGEGRAEFADDGDLDTLAAAGRLVLRYVTAAGAPAERYPANPNGSPGGATAFANADGRVLVLMPHPERVFRSLQHSWCPPEWGEDGPWLRLFENIHRWLD